MSSDVTVPPPPAVPGELIERGEMGITYARLPDGTHPDDWPTHWDLAKLVLDEVYGDIVEAARRDALRDFQAIMRRWVAEATVRDYRHACADVVDELADWIDADAPPRTLSATHADQTPVPRIPGTPERSQGHSAPRRPTADDLLGTLIAPPGTTAQQLRDEGRHE